jgi:antitoxin (DNA-binding transcriptional repressor) of toxin-antitoxin stability system
LKSEFCTEGTAMPVLAQDVVSFTTAWAQLSELADQVKAGAEKIITRNGEGYVALGTVAA